MADGSILIDTKIDQSGLEKGLGAIRSGVESAAKMAAGAIAAATAALAAGGAAVIKYGGEYETSMAKASTLFGDVEVDIDNLNQKMLSMSSETGMAASTMGDALYSALSAGIPVAEDMAGATAYLEDCARLAVAGFTDVDTAVGATAKVLNAYKMDVGETDRIHKVLMATQNKGITTVGELSASLAQVTPTAAAMGVSFEQVGAGLATMTAAGTPTAQATTQLNSLFAELGKSGTVAAENLKAATEGTKYAGMGFQDMMAAGVPLNEVLDLMGGYADANGLSLLDMFSSIEAGKAALSMAGENSATFSNNLAAMSTSADLVGDAYDKMMDTLEGQTNRLKESAKNLGISIYNGASGKLKDMAKLGNSYIDMLQKAFNANGLKGLTGALGGILGDLVSRASEFAPQMIYMAVELINSLAEGILDNADSIAEGIAGALEAAVKGMARIIPNMLSAGLQIAMKLISAIADSLPTLIPQVIEALVSSLVDLVSNIPDLLALGLKIATAIAEGIISSIPIVFAGVGEAFKNLFTNADEIAAAYAEQFAGTSAAYEAFKQGLADADTKFESAVTDAEAKKQLATDMLTLYNELAAKDVKNDTDLTLMAEYAAKIAELYPTLGEYIDPVTGLFAENTTAILDNIDAQAQLALVGAYKEYRDGLLQALADSNISLKEHEGEQKAVKEEWDRLKEQSESLSGLYDDIFEHANGDGGALAFHDNLTKIYNLIKENTDIENPLAGFVNVLADGTVVFAEGQDCITAYDTAQTQLAMAVANATDAFNIQNGTLLESYSKTEEYNNLSAETRAKIQELNDTIIAETNAYNEMAGAADKSADATTKAGDAAAEAGAAAAATGQQFELAGQGITNGATEAQTGAEGFSEAADTLADAQGKAEGATEGLETASDELATTKDSILATASDIKGAQDAATAAQTTIAEIVKTISTDAATALTTMTETAASIVLTAQGMMEAIQTAVTDSIDAIAAAGSEVATALVKAIADILTATAGDTLADTLLNALKSGITNRKDGITQEAGSVGSAALNAFASYLNYGSGSSIGSNVVNGMASGIRAGRSSVISAATAVARAAITAAKNALGIRSPSAVFRDAIGAQVSAGMGLGILDNEGEVINSVTKLAAAMQNAVLGAKMQDAVVQQGSYIGAMAAASGEHLLAGVPTSDGGGGDPPIDYVLLARAIWQEAPPSFVLEDVNGEYIAELTEPTVSAIQSRKMKNRKKG